MRLFTLLLSFLFLLFLLSSEGVSYAISLGDSSSTKSTGTPAETLYRQGVENLNNGKLKEAEKAFNGSLKLQSNLLGSILGLAQLSLKKGDVEEAGRLLQKAVSVAPKNSEAQTAWGRFLVLKKKFKEAEAAFKKAISLNPQEVYPRIDLGDLYFNWLRKPDKALETYTAALLIKPDHAGAHYASGVALYELKNIAKAQAEFEMAGRLEPNNPLSFQALGNLFTADKKYDKALDAYNSALRAKPDFFPAHMSRGEIFLIKGEDNKAMAEYDAVLKQSPKSYGALIKKGMIYQKNRQTTEAQKAYLEAIKIEPDVPVAYNNLAWMAAERKVNLEEALKWAKKAVELVPDVPQYRDTLGWVYRARGDYDKAISTLEKASMLRPQQAEVLYHLGIVYSEKGKKKEAKESLRKALELEKNFEGSDDARKLLEKIEQVH